MAAVQHPLNFPTARKRRAESNDLALALIEQVHDIRIGRRRNRDDSAPSVPDEVDATPFLFRGFEHDASNQRGRHVERLTPVVVERVDLIIGFERVHQGPVNGRSRTVRSDRGSVMTSRARPPAASASSSTQIRPPASRR